MTIISDLYNRFFFNQRAVEQQTSGRKRSFAEVEPSGTPGASSFRPKRAHMEQPERQETSIIWNVVSPIVNMTPLKRFFASEDQSEVEEREVSDYQPRILSHTKEALNEDIQFRGEVRSLDTIQALPPSRLDHSGDEVQLRKVPNPNSTSTLEGFKFTSSRKADGGSSPGMKAHHSSSKPFRIVNRQKLHEKQKDWSINLSKRMKSGRDKADRSIYYSVFQKPSLLAACEHWCNLEARSKYAQILERVQHYPTRNFVLTSDTPKRVKAIYTAKGSHEEARRLNRSLRQSMASTPIATPTAFRGHALSTPGQSVQPVISLDDEPDIDVLDSGSARKPSYSFMTSTVCKKPISPPHKQINSLQEEWKGKSVISPDFVKDLDDKYRKIRKEIGNSINREELKKRIIAEERKKIEDDLMKRLADHVRLTAPLDSVEPPKEDEEEVDDKLPEITAEMEDGISKALKARDDKVLVSAHRIPITGKDIRTLSGLAWLNDEVINFYMQMIVERGKSDGYSKVFAHNTFFYTTYTDRGYSSVRRWTKKVDIFACDMVLVPVHLGMHWCLAVLDLKKKRINYYDSMGGKNNRCLKGMLKYLEEEHQDKKGSALDISEFEAVAVDKIPLQMNGSDCGMFTCKFAEYLSRRAKITFTQKDMPYFRRRMVWEIVNNTLLKP